MSVSMPVQGPPWGDTWPSQVEFRALAVERRVIPVARRLLADDITPIGLYRSLAAARPGTFILESAESDGHWSRYSFVGVGSRATLSSVGGVALWTGDVPAGIPVDGNVLDVLEATLSTLQAPAIVGMPPLTSGLVGTLGWNVVSQWEPSLSLQTDVDHPVPDVMLCLVSEMAVVDHYEGSVWLIANAINFNDTPDNVDEAYDDAVRRLDRMQAQMAAMRPHYVGTLHSGEEPQLEFQSTEDEFKQAVADGQQAIRDGDVFQVVLSQRIDLDCPADPIDVYRVLRTINPSPYMYYFHLSSAQGADYAVVGSSPETLVSVNAGQVTTFPIAGSRPRGVNPFDDQVLAQELRADPKECAEHVMLVDLARNDLSRVCDPQSVRVVEYMQLQKLSHIMHLSSTVVGTLRAPHSALDAFRAVFPAGTLSGAPKIRAITLIDELEPIPRGIYGGTVGYFDFHGNMDMAIAIRTALIRGGRASVQAGAGVVADSVPQLEYAEARNKAAAAVRAVQIAARLSPG